MTRSTAKRPLMTLLFAVCATLATGCDTLQPMSSQGEVVADYEAGRYQQAYDKAAALATRSNGREQVEANYLAGLSAYQLGRDWTAITHLRRVHTDSDPGISGPANATIGLAYARLSRHDRAIGAYQSAVARLTGNEQAQAYYHMAVSEQKLGRWAQARTHLAIAAGKATDPGLRDAARAQLETVGFTLQFGAYGKRSNADERAQAVYKQVAAAGVGAPRIVTSTTNKGETLYLVQAGHFGTFDTALAARRKLGRTDVLITALQK